MTPLTLPPEYACIRRVGSFDELVTTRFAGDVNALCWPRALPGDYGEVVKRLGAGEGVTTIDEARLRGLSLSPEGKLAVECMLADQRLLRDLGVSPVLNCIHAYPRDEGAAVVRTDVFSFHADRAPVEADTFLCTYFGSPSEGVRNEEAKRRIEIPETRAELLRCFGGPDDESFREFLAENCYDLHYALSPGARPFSFGLGNLWRIAIQYPGCPVPPCVHRAPETRPGEPRLLLIS